LFHLTCNYSKISTEKGMRQFHIRGLDTLRGFAALSVVIGHIEQAKYVNNISNFYGRSLFTSGHEGVILFYIISGFLITLFLLEERNKRGELISKNFTFEEY